MLTFNRLHQELRAHPVASTKRSASASSCNEIRRLDKGHTKLLFSVGIDLTSIIYEKVEGLVGVLEFLGK